MINLRTIAHRHRLPIDDRGAAIPVAGGVIVRWDDPAEPGLAYTCGSSGDAYQWPEPARRLFAAKFGTLAHKSRFGLTIVFPVALLPRVLAILED